MTATAPRTPSTSRQPAIFDLVFITWAVVIPTVFAARLGNSDGDLARHLRLGLRALDDGALVRTDFFSWTKAGQPFLAFEWGSEVLFASLYRLGGLALLSVFVAVVLAASQAMLVRFLLRRGVDPLLAYCASMAAAVVSAVHWVARPHIFTFLGVALLLPLLEARRGERRQLWAYALLFILWANLHGGFVYGLLLIGIYLVGSVVEWRLGTDRALWPARTRHYALALGVGLAATVVNPNGLGLLVHVFGFFGKSAIIDYTSEFMSPDFHLLGGKIFLLAILLVVAALALVPRRPSVPRLLLVLANLAFALQSMRNIALFGMTAIPILALHIDQSWRRLPDPGGLKGVFARDEGRRRAGTWSIAVALAILSLGAAGGKVGPLTLVQDQFDAREFPVAAVREARTAGLHGRLFHEFTWGGYLLLAWPEQKVFIDGGTDHYGEALFIETINVQTVAPGWRDTLSSRRVDLVLLPTHMTLAHELAREPGWGIWYCDATAVFLQRAPFSPGRQIPTGPAGAARLWGCYMAGRGANRPT
ncbi:MAG: hypothetical protein M3Q93_06615 [Gemmatimonadota bacterium]|nr:hypothetical protein [Gemmatimonadota bacterium]